MDLIKLLVEGRIGDFKQKFAKKFTPEQIADIVDVSQSLGGRNKYLAWIGNVLEPDNDFQINLDRAKNLLRIFNDQSKNFKVRDIFQYNSLDDLAKTITELENRVRRQVKSVEGADIVYEDNKYIVVAPLDYKSSCYYGAGSKWCVASHTTTSHWDTYNRDNKLFYFIDKTKPSSDVFYKVALLQNYNGNKSFWDATDKSFSSGWIIDTEEFKRIYNQHILPYFNEKYPEEIEISKDAERLKVKREQERVNAERNRRAVAMADAEGRREYDEWDPENVSGMDEGALANALLEMLDDEGVINILTPDDRERLEEAKAQLETLQERLENGEGDLESEIEVLEDEIGELEELFDVYDLVPLDWTHYGMPVFTSYKEDIGEWAVATYDEAYSASVQAAKDLLDDIGIDGINDNFLSSYIDEDGIVSDLKYYIESDVYDNPDVYLDETEDRQLSSKQEELISDLEEKIEILKDKLSSLNSDLSDVENDESDEYEEIEEMISNTEDEIYETENEIEDIKSSPEGDWDEEKLEAVLEDKMDELKDNPRYFVENWLGQDWNEYVKDFIDLDDVAEGLVDADGLSHNLNTYDGIDRETQFNGETYYGFKVND